MKITLLTVGKTEKGWIRDGIDIYCGRLSHYVNFEIKEIPELKGVSAYSKEQIKNREGELIMKLLRPDDHVVLLDERGEQFSSMSWSANLEKLMQKGKNIVYVVGGAYGFSDDVYKRSNAMISFSKMTFSHQMIRVIFTEQLYRAFTIMNGEPYHHE